MLDQLITVSASRTTSGPGTYVVITPGVTITLENWNYWDDPDADIVIKDMTGAGSPAITVAPSGLGAAIDGAGSASINTPYQGMRFIPYKNGTTWLVESIGNCLPLAGGTLTGNLNFNPGVTAAYITCQAPTVNLVICAGGGGPLNDIDLTASSVHLTGWLSVGEAGIQYATYATNHVGFKWTGSNLHIMIDGVDDGVISVTSDARIKENIAAADEDALATIQKIAIKKFDVPLRHTERKGALHYEAGFIAQQLRDVAPDAVIAGDREEDMLSIDVLPLLARCVKALQQIEGRLKALEQAG